MGFKAVLYIGLLGLGVGCSNSDPRLQGERELLDGTVFRGIRRAFLSRKFASLAIAEAPSDVVLDPSRWQCAAYSGTCRASLRADIALVAPDWSGR